MSLDRLLALADTPLPAELRAWINQGIDAYLAGTPLEQALDLAGGPGSKTARYQYRQQLRNRYLRRAWEASPGPTPWARSVALEAAIQRFVTRLWPRLKDGDPPESSVHRALWHAFRIDPNPPASARALHRLFTGF